MNCPVEAVDHESALIQADWYEEHNQLEIAEQVRIKLGIQQIVIPKLSPYKAKSSCMTEGIIPYGFLTSMSRSNRLIKWLSSCYSHSRRSRNGSRSSARVKTTPESVCSHRNNYT